MKGMPQKEAGPPFDDPATRLVAGVSANVLVDKLHLPETDPVISANDYHGISPMAEGAPPCAKCAGVIPSTCEDSVGNHRHLALPLGDFPLGLLRAASDAPSSQTPPRPTQRGRGFVSLAHLVTEGLLSGREACQLNVLPRT
jgi:hypothetical protein